MASRVRSAPWPRPMRRSKGRERAPATRWRWRSAPSLPAAPAQPATGPAASEGQAWSSAARLAMADLRFAAWFLWIMPLLVALSRSRQASRMATVAASVSPASAASRNLRTLVFSDDLTALLRSLAFSFCLLRLIWDLMFATRKPRLGYWSGRSADAFRSLRQRRTASGAHPSRRGRIAHRRPQAQTSGAAPGGTGTPDGARTPDDMRPWTATAGVIGARLAAPVPPTALGATAPGGPSLP